MVMSGFAVAMPTLVKAESLAAKSETLGSKENLNVCPASREIGSGRARLIRSAASFRVGTGMGSSTSTVRCVGTLTP